MDNIYSVLELARVALNAERLQVSVAAENIANVNNAGYIPKSVNKTSFADLLANMKAGDQSTIYLDPTNELGNLVEENPAKRIHLDKEVFEITNSEMRYQAIAQMIKSKFGLIELVIGGKGK